MVARSVESFLSSSMFIYAKLSDALAFTKTKKLELSVFTDQVHRKLLRNKNAI